MRRRGRLTVTLGVALLSAALTLWASERPAELTDQALIETLRGGGYTLYFRHTATDWSQRDQVQTEDDWLSCDPSRMRQLSAQGRRSARAIGEAIRTLGIPVGVVLASPYCRTMETARLMDIGPVEASTDVMNLRVAEYFGGRDAIIATARTRLATPPGNATNTVIVAHGNVAREATPVYPGEGEGVVFRPDGRGGFHYVARIGVVDWARLVDSRPRKIEKFTPSVFQPERQGRLIDFLPRSTPDAKNRASFIKDEQTITSNRSNAFVGDATLRAAAGWNGSFIDRDHPLEPQSGVQRWQLRKSA